MNRLPRLLVLIPLFFALTGCDQVTDMLNKQKSNGKATGAACRYSGRSLEDCYQRNPRVARADIYAGWKEMTEYMQARKLEIVPPPPDVKTGTLAPADFPAGVASAAAEKASAAGNAASE